MSCCAGVRPKHAADEYASVQDLPPKQYHGRWIEQGGKSELRIAEDGKVDYRAVGTFVNGLTMYGWREPPEACDIEGRVLCLWETFHLALVEENVLEVDGCRYSRGSPTDKPVTKVDR